jgi:hypothetical protein
LAETKFDNSAGIKTAGTRNPVATFGAEENFVATQYNTLDTYYRGTGTKTETGESDD